jgi:thioredoxin reductase (NADPH)
MTEKEIEAVNDRPYLADNAAAVFPTLAGRWEVLGRRPLPFETSHPGLFAAGDVRAGSIKRVAAAVGEGSAAVRSVHEYLAFAHRRVTHTCRSSITVYELLNS